LTRVTRTVPRLVGAALVVFAAALHGSRPPLLRHRAARPRSTRRASASLALTLAIIASFLLDLRFGFATNSSRQVVANHLTTARRLVRFIREHVDLDGDGFSAVLGGPDCNDFDSKINPLAVEIRGSGVDENCDDISAPAVPVLTYAAAPSDSARLKSPAV